MLDIDLELFSAQIKEREYTRHALVEHLEGKVLDFFTSTIGDKNMTASHHVVLESLHELMKNAVDAGATKLFIQDDTPLRSSISRASICVVDNGSGFSRDFFATDTSHLDYGEKLGGLLAINSAKKGEHKLGGQGRGLAQAYEVLKQYDGSILCSNRAGGDSPGAHIEFYSSHAPVCASEISDLFNRGRQRFSSRYCQFNSEDECESLVASMLNHFSFLPKPKRSASQKSDNASDLVTGSFSL